MAVKKERKSENIEKGKELIEKEIKRIGITHAEIFKNEYITPMLDRYKYKDLDEMYAAVGFGAISPVKIIARMLIEYRKEHKEEEKDIEQKIEELSKAKAKKVKPSSSGIVVRGIDNCLVKLSRCCSPLPVLQALMGHADIQTTINAYGDIYKYLEVQNHQKYVDYVKNGRI